MGSGKKRWLLPVQIALALMGVAALFALSAYRGHRKALERLFERPAARVEAGRARWMDGARYEYDEGERDDDRDLRLVSPSAHRELVRSGRIEITYPPDGAVFPANFCRPRVDWADEVNTVWQVTVEVNGGTREFLATERRWPFPEDLWREVKACGGAAVVLRGARPGRGTVEESARVSISVSTDPCDPHVVYRMTKPVFDPLTTSNVYIRDVGSFREEPFLLTRRKYCLNCHTFTRPAGDGGRLAMQFRYTGPGTKSLPVYFGVYDLSAGEGWRVKLPFETQMSTFLCWSPDGKRVAVSANQSIVTFVPVVHETQYAGQETSDIAIYDAETGEAYMLPGASDPDALELLPEWSPDGSSLVFAAAPARLHPADTRYDLKRVDFSGGRGGQARFIDGASRNSKSNYYPRFSPDGRWLVFCQARRGYLIKASSDLYIMPGDLQGGSRPLGCNAPHAADSWHSWSSNSKWLVFASKRDDGVYARLYFTHIGADGRASPAVRLPLESEPLETFNVPEFVSRRPGVSERSIFEAVQVDRPYREALLRETVK